MGKQATLPQARKRMLEGEVELPPVLVASHREAARGRKRYYLSFIDPKPLSEEQVKLLPAVYRNFA